MNLDYFSVNSLYLTCKHNNLPIRIPETSRISFKFIPNKSSKWQSCGLLLVIQALKPIFPINKNKLMKGRNSLAS